MRRGNFHALCFAAAASTFSACQENSRPTVLAADQQNGTPTLDYCAPQEPGRVFRADPSNYRRMLSGLAPGDALLLTPGNYPPLKIANLRGAPGHCITITGQTGNRPTIILGEIGERTVEIIDSSYVVLSNLVIDSRGLPGADGIKASASPHPDTHHIVLEGNLIIGAGASQQTDGITIKTPTWNWVIRRNTIISAGTAIYLGDSDGTAPFIAGLIEGNVVLDPIGYGMQIKYQVERPMLAGMPETDQVTVIRNNVFKKNFRPSPDGDRPNLLVGGFPETGPGSRDLYQIYGNLLIENPREALFQGSGRISFHDNLLIGGAPAAAVFRDHDLPLKLAEVFDNKIYSPHVGIEFGSPARQGVSVFGNVIFAETPLVGFDSGDIGNRTSRAVRAKRSDASNQSSTNHRTSNAEMAAAEPVAAANVLAECALIPHITRARIACGTRWNNDVRGPCRKS